MSPNEQDPNLVNWRLEQLEDAVRAFQDDVRKLYWTIIGALIINLIAGFIR